MTLLGDFAKGFLRLTVVIWIFATVGASYFDFLSNIWVNLAQLAFLVSS